MLGEESEATKYDVATTSDLIKVSGLGKYITKCALMRVLLLQQLERCVLHITSVSVRSLPTQKLAVVKKVLQLCRIGKLTGSALFQVLELPLASLFKSTYSLLKVQFTSVHIFGMFTFALRFVSELP